MNKRLNVKTCRRCGKHNGGIITRYSLNYCRQCFREVAEDIGFRKYS
ncbi:MAG: 30S ribosomal protein S14 [Candidatus Aenigmarchaeota archaeon]|nr:30S ribosomal protein S14 [Candidatus Aenigmarchaeota archaeon]